MAQHVCSSPLEAIGKGRLEPRQVPSNAGCLCKGNALSFFRISDSEISLFSGRFHW
jgi:hypothetical protein